MDIQSFFLNDTGYSISGADLKYLIDKLCSPIYWFALRRFYMGGGIEREFKVNNLEMLPVPLPQNDHIPFSNEELHFMNSH